MILRILAIFCFGAARGVFKLLACVMASALISFHGDCDAFA